MATNTREPGRCTDERFCVQQTLWQTVHDAKLESDSVKLLAAFCALQLHGTVGDHARRNSPASGLG